MRVAVFGLGYVGSITAAALARDGHEVLAVDASPREVDGWKRAQAPVPEPGLEKLIRDEIAAGRLAATVDPYRALAGSDASLVCVGTPSRPDGSPDLSQLCAVAEQIGRWLRRSTSDHLVVVRSTVLPSDLRGRIIPLIEEASGRRAGAGWDLAVNPEFLREGCALADYDRPPRVLVGERLPGSGARVLELYAAVDAPRFSVSIEVALAVKYADNAFHALKVAFANEMARVWRELGADPGTVMDIVSRDHRLNLSAQYLDPGFAFGGGCLPKDLRALTSAARGAGLQVPLLDSVLPSNRLEVDRAVERILATGCRRVALLGLAFKRGTDDLRESALLELAGRLVDAGLELAICDPFVRLPRLRDASRACLERSLPDAERRLRGTVDEATAGAELVVVGHAGVLSEEQERRCRSMGTKVLRLA